MTREERRLLEEKYHGKRTPEYEADVGRLKASEPLAYIIGFQPFLGLKIYLDSKPLIPRPETEWWTDELLTHVGRTTSHTFLDLCAGSGAIGCAALKMLPDAKVFFGEIDPMHRATILKNIRENNLDESHADIRIGDLFEPFSGLQFDVIAANPPYVPVSRVLQKSVADFEPPLALLAGEDGLDVIRRIATELPKYLAKGGTAWVECDRDHVTHIQKLFEEQDFAAEIRTDQYNQPRIIVVSFP